MTAKSKFCKLNLLTLETRDVPALLYQVNLEGPSQGELGESALAITDGGLHTMGEVTANSTIEAVMPALGGSVQVGEHTYEMTPETIPTNPDDRTALLLIKTETGNEVRLEDLAATPQQADWDYNDHAWFITDVERAEDQQGDDTDEIFCSAEVAKTITATIGIDAKSTSSAEKGKFTPKGGTETESTDEELATEAAHFKKYDGPTEFKADYTIFLKEDGSFDASKSSIIFTTVNYTSRTLFRQQKSSALSAEDEANLIKDGKYVYRHSDTAYIYSKSTLVKSGWKTVSIPITEATLKDGKLQSFKFKSDTWYTDAEKNGIIDKGIVGVVDLVAGKASFTAKYQTASTGVIATYIIEGTIKK